MRYVFIFLIDILPRFGRLSESRNDKSLCCHTEPLQKGEVSKIFAKFPNLTICDKYHFKGQMWLIW